ncbi:MAG: Ig domain-containing protein, partial [Planctomycetes bacterium]|nr:Ig domain-containing protein [Planctomycetota bacterium]
TVWHADGLPQGVNVARIGGLWKIIGTPVLGSAGSYQVMLTLEEYDAFGSHETSATFTLIVEGETSMTGVHVLTNHLPAAQEGESYPLVILEAAGGSGSYSFDVSGLPEGLEMGAAAGGIGTHWIDGRPESGSAGEYSVTITVEDATDSSLTASVTLALVVSPASLAPSLPPETNNLGGALLAGGAAAGCSVGDEYGHAALLVLLGLMGVFARLRICIRHAEFFLSSNAGRNTA